MNSSFLLMNQARSMDLNKEDRGRLYIIWRMGNNNLLIPLMVQSFNKILDKLEFSYVVLNSVKEVDNESCSLNQMSAKLAMPLD